MTAVSTARQQTQAGLGPLLIAYAGFILLGLPTGILGVAWPSIRDTFGGQNDWFGVLFTASTIGYTLASTSSGRLVARLGMGTFLLLGSLVTLLGLLGYALAPAWWVLVGAGLAAGLGSGVIDAGLNTYVATNHSAGRLNWMHAFFGVGATLGPQVMTRVLDAGIGWQWGYLAVAALQLGLTLAIGLTLPRWWLSRDSDDSTAANGARAVETLRLPVVWFGIALFILYTGIESTGGNWTFTLFAEGRGVDPNAAGLWVSLYWGGLTAGRFLMGAIADRVENNLLLRLCLSGTVFGALLIALNVSGLLNQAGMALMGLAQAAVFPTLIAVTPGRVGPAHAANAIGFQVGAAGVGFAILPSLAGVLAQQIGLESIPPAMVISGLLWLVLYEVSVRWAARRERVAVAN